MMRAMVARYADGLVRMLLEVQKIDGQGIPDGTLLVQGAATTHRVGSPQARNAPQLRSQAPRLEAIAKASSLAAVLSSGTYGSVVTASQHPSIAMGFSSASASTLHSKQPTSKSQWHSYQQTAQASSQKAITVLPQPSGKPERSMKKDRTSKGESSKQKLIWSARRSSTKEGTITLCNV
jgi:hypothetical protein